MSSPVPKAILSSLLKPQPPLTAEQEFFLQVLRDVGKSKRAWKLERSPIQDLCKKQYSLWTQCKAEFERREAARKLPWPRYRALSELDGSLRATLESWAVTNRLTYVGVAAGWVVRWATDVFTCWDKAGEDRQLFIPQESHYLPGITVSDPPPEYLMIPMECPRRKRGERTRDFVSRANKALQAYIQSTKNLGVVPAPPKRSKAQSARSGSKRRQYLDHLSLALRVCGLQLKEIEPVLDGMGPRFVRSLSTISRGAARVAKLIQLDLP